MQLASPSNRNNWRIALPAVILACLVFAFTGMRATAQPAPDPKPETVPYFYDPEGVFDEAQQNTLIRDAQLVQSSDIPTLIYIRTATVDTATPDTAKALAEDVRETWGVESADGADDGLVLLYSHVPDNPGSSTIVASWGTATFEDSGLSPDYVEELLAGNPRSLLDEGHPFEAVVYAIRELRYGGIYLPPPTDPIEGTRSVVHTAANIIGPVLVIAVAVGLALVTFRNLVQNVLSGPVAWALGGTVTIGLVGLAALSIYGQSSLGIACTVILVVIVGLQVWVWTRPSRHTSDDIRRSVPPTSQRMRKRAQTRRMHPSSEVRA